MKMPITTIITMLEIAPSALPSAALAVEDSQHDILNALLALGYNEREAAAAMKPLAAGISTSDGIRQALKLLSKA